MKLVPVPIELFAWLANVLVGHPQSFNRPRRWLGNKFCAIIEESRAAKKLVLFKLDDLLCCLCKQSVSNIGQNWKLPARFDILVGTLTATG